MSLQPLPPSGLPRDTVSLEGDACGDRGPRAARAARRKLGEGAERGRVDFFAGRRGPLEGAAHALDVFEYVNSSPEALARVDLDRDFLPALEMLRRTAQGRYLPEEALRSLTSLARHDAVREPCLAALGDFWRDGLLEVVREGAVVTPGSADLGRLLADDVALAQPGRLVFEAPPRLSELGRRQAEELLAAPGPDPHLASRLPGDTVEALIAEAEARSNKAAVEVLTTVVKASAGDPGVRTLLEPHRERLAHLVSRIAARGNLGGRQVDAAPEAAYLEALLAVFPLDDASRTREVLPLLFPRLDGVRTRGAAELAGATPGLAPELFARGQQVGLDRERYRLLAGAVERGEWTPSPEDLAWVGSQVEGWTLDKPDSEAAGAVDLLAKVRDLPPGVVPAREVVEGLLAEPPAQAAERLYAPDAGPQVRDLYRLLFPDAGLETALADRLEAALGRSGTLSRLDGEGQAALAILASVAGEGLEDRLGRMLADEAFRAQRTPAAERLAGVARDRDLAAGRAQGLEERLESLLARGGDESFVLRAWRHRVATAEPAEAAALASSLADRWLPGGSDFEVAALEALGDKVPGLRDRMLAELGVGVRDPALLRHAHARLREGGPPSQQALSLRILEASAHGTSGWTPVGQSWTAIRQTWQEGLRGWMAGLPRVAGDQAWVALGALVDAAAPAEPTAEDLDRLAQGMGGNIDEACRIYVAARALEKQGLSWEEARRGAMRQSLLGETGPAGSIVEGEGEVHIGGLTLPVRDRT